MGYLINFNLKNNSFEFTCKLIAAMKSVASLQPYACKISAMSGGMVRNGEAPVTVGVIKAICRYFLK